MTINELANVHRANIDNVTNEEISHREKWGRVINALGYEEVKCCVPFTLAEIKEALPKDKHLNNLPLPTWDRAGGWQCERGGAYRIPSALTPVLRNAGVTSYSPSDCVCILKETARLWAEE